jgi:hypothetical protein
VRVLPEIWPEIARLTFKPDSECGDEKMDNDERFGNGRDEASEGTDGPFMQYFVIPPKTLVNFDLVFTGRGEGAMRPATRTSDFHEQDGGQFVNPKELTEMDESFMEYFRRQLESIDSVDDALGEIDTGGYDFTENR